MKKEDVILAREIINDFQERRKAQKSDKDINFSFLNINDSCNFEDLSVVKKFQQLNRAFLNARATEKIYICLGGYYDGMGTSRIKNKEVYNNSTKKGIADFFYYINIEDDRDRLCIRKSERKNFEKKNVIIYLNKTDIVSDNFNAMENIYYEIRLFYLQELLKSDLEEDESIIASKILTKIKEKDFLYK